LMFTYVNFFRYYLPAIKLIIFNRGNKAIRQLYIARKPEASGIEVKFPAELMQDPETIWKRPSPS